MILSYTEVSRTNSLLPEELQNFFLWFCTSHIAHSHLTFPALMLLSLAFCPCLWMVTSLLCSWNSVSSTMEWALGESILTKPLVWFSLFTPRQSLCALSISFLGLSCFPSTSQRVNSQNSSISPSHLDSKTKAPGWTPGPPPLSPPSHCPSPPLPFLPFIHTSHPPNRPPDTLTTDSSSP